MTTRLRGRSGALPSASTRATSRSIVVLPTPGRPSEQDALAGLDDVLDDVDRAVDRAAHAARQAHDVPAPVANGGDAVQRALHAGAIVRVELADARHHQIDVGSASPLDR